MGPAVFAALLLGLLLIAPAGTAWADECPAGGSHDFEAELLVPNSDDEGGLQRFTCLKCGYSYEAPIPATGHTWGAWQTVVEATCEESGVERRICQSDASHVEERVTPPLSADGTHEWVEADREDPGCETGGWVLYRCSRCGAETTEALVATGHEWGQWETVEPATSEREGLERRVCAHDAGHVEQRAIPILEATPAADGPPAENPAPVTHKEPASAAPAPAPAPEPEPVDPWAPNALDAALLGVDLAGAGVFAFLMFPLVHARRWVVRHRAMAKAAAFWKEAPHDRA